MGRLSAALLWLGLVGITLVAPPVRDDVGPWLTALISGDWGSLEPWIVTHFQLMGVWPGLFALLLRGDGPRSWAFRGSAFFVGCFGLLPWLVWRSEPTAAPPSRLWAAIAALLGAVAVALLGWAGVYGSWSAWLAEARADGFVNIMAFDFLAFWLASIIETRQRGARWWWTFLPVVGLAAWLVERDAAT